MRPSRLPRACLDERRVHSAMVLCAGLGSRLRPLTYELAKPMVPVGDRPAVAHVVSRVRLAGISRIVVNVHHRPDDVRGWAQDERIFVADEPELLGTAGGVAAARSALGDGSVLLWNGDILTDLDARELVRAHEEHGLAATLAVRARPAGHGNVGLDETGRIVRLRTSSFGDEFGGGDFLGVHVLGAALRRELPERGCLVTDVYLPALARGEHLLAHPVDVSFVDVGSLGDYLAANAQWLASRGARSWAHPSAIVNAAIDGSVVGAGAVVDAPATSSVVWPGAHVTVACRSAVITKTAATKL